MRIGDKGAPGYAGLYGSNGEKVRTKLLLIKLCTI